MFRVLRRIDFSGLSVVVLGIVTLLLIPVFYAPDQIIYVGGDPERQITTGMLALCCGAVIVGGFGYQIYAVARVAVESRPNGVKVANPALGPLIQALKVDVSDSSRMRAAVALGNLGNPRAVEALVAALNDESLVIRQAAADALIKLGWTADRSAAGAAFWAARGEWAKCVEIGTLAVEPLILVLKEDFSKDRRAAAATALGDIGDRRATAGLRAAQKSSYCLLRDAAAHALGRMDARARANARPPD